MSDKCQGDVSVETLASPCRVSTFAAVPYHALDTYLPKLIRAGKRVAICDQIEDPKAKTLVKRSITDLVSGAEQPAEPAAPKRRERKPKAEQSDMTFNDESAE